MRDSILNTKVHVQQFVPKKLRIHTDPQQEQEAATSTYIDMQEQEKKNDWNKWTITNMNKS